jgi:hypothetical protein
MTDYAKQFRNVVAQRSKGRRGGGRYSRELRELALQHLRRARSKGEPAANAARDLGIDPNTLRGWERRDRPVASKGTFRPVRVVEHRNPDKVGYVVFGPASLRVECDDASQVAALFRALA